MFIQKAELRKFRDISFLAESILRNIPHMKCIVMRFKKTSGPKFIIEQGFVLIERWGP